MTLAQKKPEKSALAATARQLIRAGRFVPLATQEAKSAAPFVSLAQTACLMDAVPLLLISRLAAHTRHIEANPEISLLFETPGAEGAERMNLARVSVQGRAEKLEGEEAARAKARFTALHPETRDYDTALDFSYYALRPSGGRIVEGFGRIGNLSAADLTFPLEGAEALVDGAEGITAHMNEDHADAIALYAEKLLGRQEGAWRMSGIDPEGADLVLDTEVPEEGTPTGKGRHFARLDFPAPVFTPTEARQMLVALVKEARAKA